MSCWALPASGFLLPARLSARFSARASPAPILPILPVFRPDLNILWVKSPVFIIVGLISPKIKPRKYLNLLLLFWRFGWNGRTEQGRSLQRWKMLFSIATMDKLVIFVSENTCLLKFTATKDHLTWNSFLVRLKGRYWTLARNLVPMSKCTVI